MYENLGLEIFPEHVLDEDGNLLRECVAGIMLYAESKVVFRRLIDLKALTQEHLTVPQSFEVTESIEDGWERFEGTLSLWTARSI